MSNFFASVGGHAELAQNGEVGQASANVQLAAPNGTVSVDVSASMGLPSQLAGPQPGDMSADGWAHLRS